jgi:hypothetical protein
MSKLDSCHYEVVHALEKQGWTVDPKPLALVDRISAMMIRIDLYAEREENQRIIVEVKCYPEHNKTQELYISFGQYIMYRAFLQIRDIDAPLYLAVPKPIFDTHFHRVIRKAIQDNGIKLIVVDVEAEEIVEWIE